MLIYSLMASIRLQDLQNQSDRSRASGDVYGSNIQPGNRITAALRLCLG